MLELMFASEGIGLSQTQVGINARCFVMVLHPPTTPSTKRTAYDKSRSGRNKRRRS